MIYDIETNFFLFLFSQKFFLFFMLLLLLFYQIIYIYYLKSISIHKYKYFYFFLNIFICNNFLQIIIVHHKYNNLHIYQNHIINIYMKLNFSALVKFNKHHRLY